MATLADINKTLNRVDDNTETTSKGIGSFLSYLQQNKRKELEAAREQRKAVVDTTQARAADATDRGGKGGVGSIFGGIRNILAGATVARLAPMLGKTILKRVLGPAAIAVFAEDIVEFLLPDGFENEAIKNALTGGVQGAAIGFAVGGPLGAAIGAGLGVLFKNEKFKNAVTELTKTIKEQAKVLYEKLEPTLIRFKESFVNLFNSLGITKEGVTEGLAKALTTIGNAAASGVESITKLIKGDFEPMDIVKGITTLGTVAALLMPGKFVKLLGLLAGRKGLLGVLTKAAGALGLGFGAASLATDTDASTKTRGKQTVGKPGSVVMSRKGNLMIAGADGKATSVKAPPGAKLGDIPGKPKVPSKFGRFLKFLKIPGIAQIMAATDAFMILSSDMPLKEKINAMGGIFGGLLGSGLGLKLGAAIGLIGGPPGVALGSLIGTMGGYFAGDYFGKKIAELLFGDQSSDSASLKKPAGSDVMRMGRGGPTQTFTKPGSTGAVTMKSNISGGGRPDAIGGNTSVIDNSSSSNIVNNNTTAIITKGNVLDAQDQFLHYV